MSPTPVAIALIAAALVAATLIRSSLPLLQRCALARPNARSSHLVPTPQGGGASVVLACLGVSAVLLAAAAAGPPPWSVLSILAGGTLALAALGAWDDLRPLGAAPRLALQFGVAGVLAAGLPATVSPLPLPPLLVWAIATLAIVWFVNLVNFMDGLDWITVAEMVPVTLALTAFGLAGILPPAATIVAAALAGALLGFAPFNRPVARLFLGDVGSLPIGLLVAWLLLQLATAGHHAAALLLPGYYLADATVTLLQRLARRERVWEAHRSHYYQRATDGGFTAMEVARGVAALNLVLAGLAALTIAVPTLGMQFAALAVGAALIGFRLHRFAWPRRAGAS